MAIQDLGPKARTRGLAHLQSWLKGIIRRALKSEPMSTSLPSYAILLYLMNQQLSSLISLFMSKASM